MRSLLKKELRLCASCLSYLFIAFGLLFLVPGYPILCGVFFVTLGIYQSFLNARETNDILFSALLPVAKRDVVKGKYLFVCLIELCGICVMACCVLLRGTLWAQSGIYANNVMMNANGFALGLAFLIFGLFNAIFVGGFFKTAYKIGRPFVLYIVAAFLVVGIGETLHHLPGLAFLNGHGIAQALSAAVGAVVYLFMTLLSCRRACERFEKIDL